MLVEKIKSDRTAAMKAKDSAKLTFLTTLYSEIAMFGKSNGNRDTTDAEAVKIIQKFVKGAEETIVICEKTGRDTTKSKFELGILAEYMPKQMTEAEVKAAVDAIVASVEVKDMKSVMAELKARHGGQYDGKIASAIVKAAI